MPVRPVRLDKDNNPGNARWCDECTPDGRLECAKLKKRTREPCHAPAIRGTDSCKIHSGVTRAMAHAKGEVRITAWQAMGDTAKTIDYRLAVLSVLQMTWLRLSTYSEMLRRQVALEGEQAGSTGEDDPQTSGLIGYRYGASNNGATYVQSEEVRALVTLEAAERDRVVKYAKIAHDMGISDRLTSIAERWGDIVATRVTAMFEALELTPDQQDRLPALVESHLGSIDVMAMGANGKEEP